MSPCWWCLIKEKQDGGYQKLLNMKILASIKLFSQKSVSFVCVCEFFCFFFFLVVVVVGGGGVSLSIKMGVGGGVCVGVAGT